ncbi:DUF3199 family protein [Exiguobacterium sp. s21]|uniref:protein YqbG n=1 Tax=Exiguobacterium sp. s21 TaxID=2751244 RepID=UPI001BE827E9|nr:DUF3199 family protein [Exiguobacterium sp. s21]
MPLITPAQVKAYSTFDEVKERADTQLEVDIMQAEADVFAFVGHEFPLGEYPSLPAPVRSALLLLSEHYALVRGDESLVKGFKSEKLKDYSYTKGDNATLAGKPEIANLLRAYVKGGSGGGVRLRIL